MPVVRWWLSVPFIEEVAYDPRGPTDESVELCDDNNAISVIVIGASRPSLRTQMRRKREEKQRKIEVEPASSSLRQCRTSEGLGDEISALQGQGRGGLCCEGDHRSQ